MYKYDLGHILSKMLMNVVEACCYCCIELVVQSVREREREREEERGSCLLVVTTACGEEEDKMSLPLCFFDIVFLFYSAFCSLWAAVVFPTFGFSTLIFRVSSFFLICFRAYIDGSVVAERNRESNPITLFPLGTCIFILLWVESLWKLER